MTAGEGMPVEDAREVAQLMAALGTSSRVRILARLRAGACAVGELADAVDMAQPAVSHQLRVLRDLGFVVGTRRGRLVVYALHDPHIGSLLDEALRHIDHRRAAPTQPHDPHPHDPHPHDPDPHEQEHR